MIPAEFHFLRPEWLLAIVPAVLLAIFAWRRVGSGRSNWARVVDSHLLKHLVLKEKARGRKWPVIALLAGWTLASVAAAGPAWERLPTPALGRIDPTVIVMSLAQSMNATDQSPTRLTRARHKAEDILARMKGGQVGLVVFADAPFVASPLTEDSKVVSQMMPELATDLMPVLNDRLDLAITRAAELLKNAGAASGRIVVLTDSLGDEPQYSIDAAKTAASEGYDVNVIGVGTATGAPLVAYDGTTMRDQSGTTRMTRMDEAALKSLAVAGHGEFSPLTAGDGDLDKVLAQAVSPVSANPLTDTDLKADEWRDMGPWLLLLPLVLAPLAFRRGWLSAIVLAAVLSAGMPGVLPAGRAFAADEAAGAAPAVNAEGQSGGSIWQRPEWKNLWQTPDQQGASAFASGDYATAAQSFQNPAWQASALYKAGEYDKAAGAFQSGASADYNKGNALARAGKLEDAIKSYDAALAANPGDADAKYNRDLVQKLLDQQKQQQDQQDQQNQKNDDRQSSDQQKDGGKGQDGKDQQDQSQGQNGKNDDKSGKNQDSAQDQSDQKNGGKGADDQQQDGKDQQQDKSQDKSQDQAGNQPQDQKDEPGKDDPSKGDQQQGDQQQGDQQQNGQPDQASQGDSQQQNAQNGGDQQDKAGQDKAGQDNAGQDKAQQDNAQDQQQAGSQQQQSGGQSQGQDQQPQQAAGGNDPAADKAAQENAQSELKKALDEAINKSRAAQTAQAGQPAQPPPQNQQQAAVEGTGAMTEEDQTREQMLRMIPDDPTGLLRARIRSHYSNLGLTQ